MDDFYFAEPPGTTLESTPTTVRTQFGDGYAQEAPAGLNPLGRQWTLPWRGVDDAVADEMVAFFTAHIGRTFVWTPLWETLPRKVKCTRWTRVQTEQAGISDISATFAQVYEP